MIGTVACLQALGESIIDRKGDWDCTPQAKSDIYDCLVLVELSNVSEDDSDADTDRSSQQHCQ